MARSASAIAAEVEDGVREGLLRPEDPLPPIREAAAAVGIAPGTVASAYRVLGERGITVAQGRRGTRIAPRPPVVTTAGPSAVGAGADLRRRDRRPPGDGVLDLASGNPDPVLLPDLSPFLGGISPRQGYDEPPVLPALGERAEARFRADGVPDGPIAVVHSTMDGVERALRAHLRPSDTVAVEDPCWPRAIDLLRGMGLRLLPMPVDSRGPTVDGLDRALRAGADAVLITTRVQNPTGAVVTAGRRSDLAEVLGAHQDVLCIEDDHTAELSGSPLCSLGGLTARWALIRSSAKAFGPDLRVSVMTGDPTTISRVQGGLELGSGWVSSMLQQVLVACWNDDMASVTAQATEIYARRRAAVQEAFAARGLMAMGRSGLNVWVPVRDEAAAVARAGERGIRISGGARFRLSSPPAVRVTTAAIPAGAVELVADAVASAASERMA